MASTTIQSSSIPLFDLSDPKLSSNLARSLVQAAHEYGFLYVRNPPMISASCIETMFQLSCEFFHSPTSLKEQYAMQRNNRGWTAPHSEALDPQQQKHGDPKEAFNFGGIDAHGHADQPLPRVFVENSREISQFAGACSDICQRVLELIAEGLGIENTERAGTTVTQPSGQQWFASSHDPSRGESGTILRLLHYPASAAGSGVRAGAHSDYGSLTLLFRQRGDAGLEIQPPRNRRSDTQSPSPNHHWLSVPTNPPGTENDAIPPVLVNIGDLLSYWTGGWLRSTVHRVVVPRDASAVPERHSIAYFCHPLRDTPLLPVPSQIIARHVAQQAANGNGTKMGSDDSALANTYTSGKVLTASEHLQQRLKATYGWSK